MGISVWVLRIWEIIIHEVCLDMCDDVCVCACARGMKVKSFQIKCEKKLFIESQKRNSKRETILLKIRRQKK